MILGSSYPIYVLLYALLTLSSLGLGDSQAVVTCDGRLGPTVVHYCKELMNGLFEGGQGTLQKNFYALKQKQIGKPVAISSATPGWFRWGSCAVFIPVASSSSMTTDRWKSIETSINAIYRKCVVRGQSGGIRDDHGATSVYIGDPSAANWYFHLPPSFDDQETEPLLPMGSNTDSLQLQPPSSPASPNNPNPQAAVLAYTGTGITPAQLSPNILKRACRCCLDSRGTISEATKDTIHAACDGIASICAGATVVAWAHDLKQLAGITAGLASMMVAGKGAATYCGIQPPKSSGLPTPTGSNEFHHAPNIVKHRRSMELWSGDGYSGLRSLASRSAKSNRGSKVVEIRRIDSPRVEAWADAGQDHRRV